jgi:hypothetical protein
LIDDEGVGFEEEDKPRGKETRYLVGIVIEISIFFLFPRKIKLKIRNE